MDAKDSNNCMKRRLMLPARGQSQVSMHLNRPRSEVPSARSRHQHRMFAEMGPHHHSIAATFNNSRHNRKALLCSKKCNEPANPQAGRANFILNDSLVLSQSKAPIRLLQRPTQLQKDVASTQPVEQAKVFSSTKKRN